jgi:hypothetical protein
MESDQKYFDTQRELLELQTKHSHDEMVEILQKRIKATSDRGELLALREVLALSYNLVGNTKGARQTFELLIDMQDHSALSLSSLASHYLYAEANLQKAFEVIELAEQASNLSGKFQRMVLGQKARIALAADRYDVLNDCLDAIPKVPDLNDAVDVAREKDFFIRADKSRLVPEVVERYQNYINAKPRTG